VVIATIQSINYLLGLGPSLIALILQHLILVFKMMVFSFEFVVLPKFLVILLKFVRAYHQELRLIDLDSLH